MVFFMQQFVQYQFSLWSVKKKPVLWIEVIHLRKEYLMCRPKSITTRLQFNLLPFFRVRDSFQKSKRPKVMAIFVQRKLLVLIIGLNGLNWVSELYVEIIQIMWSCVEFMPLRLQHFSKVKVSKTRRFSSSTCLKISRGRKCRTKTRITFFFLLSTVIQWCYT